MIREDTAVQTPQPAASPEVAELPAITLTTAAAAKLSEVMAEKGMEDHALRVFVSGGGCSGFQYGMAFENEIEDGDLVFANDRAPDVVVDPVSINYLKGASIDFVDSLMGGGFKIENPNATSGCGCGSSFRTDGQAAPDEKQSGGACGC